MNPEEVNVTYTVMEDEYREAIAIHGEESAFRTLEWLYESEVSRRSGESQ